MRALVIYESHFGNTHDVASSIADGLSTSVDVTLSSVTTAPERLPDDVGLLVVGGPTHVLGLSRKSTRQDAIKQGAPDPHSADVGLREWLDGLAPAGRTVPIAAFDTKMRRPKLPGSAAHRAAAKLRHSGFTSLDRPKTFWVDGTAGPLLDGERERAAEWGRELGALVGFGSRSESRPESG